MKVIIVGCGRTGAMLATALCEKGHDVAVVDADAASFGRLDAAFKGRTLEGVAFDRDVLLRAGIEDADALAAVTDDDMSNLLVVQISRKFFDVPRVVARLFEPERAPLYEVIGVPVVTSVSWRARCLEQFICHSTMSVMDTLGNGEVLQVDLLIPDALRGFTVEQLSSPGHWFPSALTRGGVAQIAEPSLKVHSGDVVHLTVASDALDALDTWLREQNAEVEACAL